MNKNDEPIERRSRFVGSKPPEFDLELQSLRGVITTLVERFAERHKTSACRVWQELDCLPEGVVLDRKEKPRYRGVFDPYKNAHNRRSNDE